MDVKQFKLDTGEEIIGQVLEYVDEDDSITVSYTHLTLPTKRIV